MSIPLSKNHIQKNRYKETNVFKCIHDVHQEFKSLMSPFHILNEKKCYPQGCVYFKWKCKLLAKKKRCFRNFEYVGRECFNCRYFYEEKIHQYPELLRQDKNEYFQDFEHFEEWVQHLKKKRVRCEGTITELRPNVSLLAENTNLQYVLHGFLIRFNSGYIDNIFFEDSFYLSISVITQNKLRFRRGDEVEFDATLILDRGRFKFIKCGNLIFYERGNGIPLDRSHTLVQVKTSTVQEGQPPKCLNCRHGLLTDIERSGTGPRRAVICLAQEKTHRLCSNYDPYKPDHVSETCAAMTCHHTL